MNELCKTARETKYSVTFVSTVRHRELGTEYTGTILRFWIFVGLFCEVVTKETSKETRDLQK